MMRKVASARALRSLTTASERFDVVIVGGGVVGSSVAFHLAREQPSMRIAVVERDASYSASSALLSAGGIRQQFSLRENVQLSIYGIDFLLSLIHI